MQKCRTFWVGVVLAAGSLAGSASALEITGTDDVQALYESFVLAGSGIVVLPGTSLSVAAPGGSQAALYTNDSGTLGLPGPGILFSTGNAANVLLTSPLDASGDGFANGSQISSSFGVLASAAQNARLASITGKNVHLDAVQFDLVFDAPNDAETLSFIGAFGTDAQPLFVNRDGIDGASILHNGVEIGDLTAPGSSTIEFINADHSLMADIAGTALNEFIVANGVPFFKIDIDIDQTRDIPDTLSFLLADGSADGATDSGQDSVLWLSSFGNYNVNDGTSEFTPLLPQDPPPGGYDGFVFDLDVETGKLVYIDPLIATGYEYETNDDSKILQVKAPSRATVNDPDGYTIHYTDAAGNEYELRLQPGQLHTFEEPVAQFVLKDISEELLLDPDDPIAFRAALSFDSTEVNVTQTPITVFVDGPTAIPEPGTLALFAVGAAGIGAAAHRRRKSKR